MAIYFTPTRILTITLRPQLYTAMPGRPRTTLREIEDVLSQLEDLGLRIFEMMPKQYTDNSDLNDARCVAWRTASKALVSTYVALSELSALIEEKVRRAESRRGIASDWNVGELDAGHAFHLRTPLVRHGRFREE